MLRGELEDTKRVMHQGSLVQPATETSERISLRITHRASTGPG